MTGGGVDSGSACVECLRRAWLVAQLGPWIQNVVDDKAGHRTPELLRLGNEELVQAVAEKEADQFLSWAEALAEGAMVEALARAECWACCRHHGDFPGGLGDGADAPWVVIGRGAGIPLRDLGLGNTVTVVGARKATGYGLEVAGALGRELAASGLNVVSGMALGIDAAAHRGALEMGLTVAVLGCGPDRAYPARHQPLYRQILERGLIISEMPPGATARRWNFPARNRIMAALAGMTVVVEAASRSGSLITAEMAADAGRDVGAVPGQVTARVAAGTNDLIANGAAVVRGADDVLDRMPGARIGQALFGPALEVEQAAVLEAVEAGCRTVDEIAAGCGRDAGVVAGHLAQLEVKGYISGSMTGTWSRTTLAAYPSGREREPP